MNSMVFDVVLKVVPVVLILLILLIILASGYVKASGYGLHHFRFEKAAEGADRKSRHQDPVSGEEG